MNLAQVTASVISAWQTSSLAGSAEGDNDGPPEPGVLDLFVTTAFEASLLREENRSLRFRLILRHPDAFSETSGPPEALQRLPFDKHRPFSALELRRLAPAVDQDRSLIGVCLSPENQLEIWGIVHSGPRWLEQFYGGRGKTLNLPDSLILGVYDPGYLVISQGARLLCTLEGGVLQAHRMNVFDTAWFPRYFAAVRQELREHHEAARAESGMPWAAIDPEFVQIVGQQMLQRLISIVQRSRHGGTLLIVPVNRAEQLIEEDGCIKLKYKFVGEEPRSRFRRLMVRTMNTLAAAGVPADGVGSMVGWADYGRAADRRLSDLDEAIFELAHLVATLTAVDGAAVVTARFELLGFAAEIAGSLPEVSTVARARDPEGNEYQLEKTENVGMRHRSVYRFCNTWRDALAIVVSQDGSACFVRWHDGRVMYWNHSPVTPP